MPGDPSHKLELVRGEVVTVCRPGFRHGLIQGRISRKLDDFATDHRTRPRDRRERADYGTRPRYRPRAGRGRLEFRAIAGRPRCRSAIPEVAADLCVEILSPSDRPGEMKEKLREYFTRGVRMVWVVDPEDRAVRVHRSPDEAQLLYESATLTCDDVLPGFTCRVAELFA